MTENPVPPQPDQTALRQAIDRFVAEVNVNLQQFYQEHYSIRQVCPSCAHDWAAHSVAGCSADVAPSCGCYVRIVVPA